MNENTPTKWDNELRTIAAILDKLPMEKTVKWGIDVYMYNGRKIVSYGAFKNYFAVWFYNGVFLADPHKVLINAQEGKTKSLRQWRMTSKTEIDEQRLTAYVMEAIEVERRGLKVAPSMPKAIEIPPIMMSLFDTESELKAAFESLTNGCKRQYIEYINEAKQETTQKRRLDKIKPMILQKKGLNDKYR